MKQGELVWSGVIKEEIGKDDVNSELMCINKFY